MREGISASRDSASFPPRSHLLTMERRLLMRLHNPRNSTCGCDADCWCNRMAVGRAVKWWFPARWFGIEHKDSRRDTMFVGWSEKDIKYWERAEQRQARKWQRSYAAEEAGGAPQSSSLRP